MDDVSLSAVGVRLSEVGGVRLSEVEAPFNASNLIVLDPDSYKGRSD